MNRLGLTKSLLRDYSKICWLKTLCLAHMDRIRAVVYKNTQIDVAKASEISGGGVFL